MSEVITNEDIEEMREQLHAMCLQLGIHPMTFDDTEFIMDAIRRVGVKRSQIPQE